MSCLDTVQYAPQCGISHSAKGHNTKPQVKLLGMVLRTIRVHNVAGENQRQPATLSNSTYTSYYTLGPDIFHGKKPLRMSILNLRISVPSSTQSGRMGTPSCLRCAVGSHSLNHERRVVSQSASFLQETCMLAGLPAYGCMGRSEPCWSVPHTLTSCRGKGSCTSGSTYSKPVMIAGLGQPQEVLAAQMCTCSENLFFYNHRYGLVVEDFAVKRCCDYPGSSSYWWLLHSAFKVQSPSLEM